MNNPKLPRIDIPKTRSEWMMDIVGYVALIIMAAILIMNWRDMPNEVPAHFDGSGNVDRWGSKMELLILPGIAIAMHFFLMVFEKFPQSHNYPERLNESNREAFYQNSRQTLNYMRNIINILFAYIVYRTVAIALGDDAVIGWPFFAILIVMFVIIIWKIIKTSKIK